VKPTRGERNNNPGNIREYPGDMTAWQGERSTDDDAEFEEFDSAELGIRALAKVLLSYQRKYGIRSVRGFIRRWAPPVENNTDSYERAVSKRMGVTPEESLDITHEQTLASMVKAIIWHENGRCIYSDVEIGAGVQRALA
jgi:hypothetical protein